MHLKTLIDQLTHFANLETCPVRDECQPGFVAGAYWGWGEARNRIAQMLKQHPLGASATEFQAGYSIALQRAIEHHCRGLAVPQEIAADCPHHAAMLDRARDEAQGAAGDCCECGERFPRSELVGNVFCPDCAEDRQP